MDDAQADNLDGRLRRRDHRRQHLRRGAQDAGLKTRQEYRAEKKQILETPVEERIGALEARRTQLVGQLRPLEKKREELRLRIEKQEKEKEQEQQSQKASPESRDR
ncbi:hypothetical protein F5Y08DRAFT_346028 [Xylaria arbuscula]|nr:hypothetical protein F5Y08DRAFT_346028 [Xylaria arbuscula]